MSGSASFQRVRKAWIGAEGIKLEFSLQSQQQPIALLISSVQPPESLIWLSQVGIKEGNPAGRIVASLALRLPDFNAFRESTLPAR